MATSLYFARAIREVWVARDQSRGFQYPGFLLVCATANI
jgi:hypothetical protein